jgi:hypothetical protein
MWFLFFSPEKIASTAIEIFGEDSNIAFFFCWIYEDFHNLKKQFFDDSSFFSLNYDVD